MSFHAFQIAEPEHHLGYDLHIAFASTRSCVTLDKTKKKNKEGLNAEN
jgi:hypothetical protein